MSQLELKQVRKSFGHVEVIHGVDLVVNDAQLTVLLGPSGCGKSTLLRMIAGIEEISSGSILIDGVRVNDTAPKKRGCAMVFQNYALYPHKKVFDNIAFPLLMARMDKPTIGKKVRAAAQLLQLEEYLDRLPRDLSGGQRQRVAMGRAIVREPKAFLFDEPLSNLDAELRVQMRLEIAQLQRKLDATMIFVTHDQVEAMTLAHKIVVMRDGYIEQEDAPRKVYNHPANLFVARFVGTPAMNVIDVVDVETDRTSSRLTLSGGYRIELPYCLPAAPTKLGARSEHLSLAPGPDHGRIRLGEGSYAVIGAEHLGDRSYRYLAAPFGDIAILQLADEDDPELQGELSIGFDLARVHFFDESGRAIRIEGRTKEGVAA